MVARCQTLDGFALESGVEDGLAVGSLEPGTVLTVHTRHSRYRLVVLGGARVVVSGGSMIPDGSEARLQGATLGGSAVKVGWIGLGLQLELLVGRQRITTSRVQSIDIESVPVRSAALVA